MLNVLKNHVITLLQYNSRKKANSKTDNNVRENFIVAEQLRYVGKGLQRNNERIKMSGEFPAVFMRCFIE